MRKLILLAATLLSPAALCAAELAKGPHYGTWGVALTDMDTHAKPGDDFFQYVEGSWLRDHPIAADKTGAGYNYELPDEIEQQVRGIVEQQAKSASTPIERQVGDFYKAWMDQGGVETRGLKPLAPYLARIDAVQTRAQLAALMLDQSYASPVEIGITADRDDPTRYIVEIGQARLGLPTRDYYLLKGKKYEDIRAAYRAYIVDLHKHAGIPDPVGRADRIVALETQLATNQWTPEQQRDPVATHNPMSEAQLQAFAPAFSWRSSLAANGLGNATRVNVSEKSAVAAAARQFAAVPLSTWKEYLTFRFITDHASYLPRAIDDAHFAFYGKTLNGIPEQRARWKRGMGLIDDSLGEAVGQIYVQQHWPASTAKEAAELVTDMRAAYADKIEHASWMDESTRAQAMAKLASFDPRLGHPVHWIDYSTLKVSPTDPLANAVASDDFQWRLQLARYPKPVDRTLWFMTPQTVNAYYEPTMNQITFPAGILQPPFFDAAADPAVNYAEAGGAIGHEMGHGFDDEGRKYDAQGRLRDWWTKPTAAKYMLRADKLAAQFDTYEPIPGVHIKGRLTLGENLADLGGLEAAYGAYRRYVARHGEPPVIDGYTGDQRFFIAYAASWQGKQREDATRSQLLSNPHSPDKYRVNGIVRNFDPWYAAFNVKPGDKMYLAPKDRVHVWE